MPTRAKQHQHGRVRNLPDRGATAVEMSIIATLLFAMIFGVMETGLAFRTSHSNQNAAVAGIRAASIGSNTHLADFDALQAIGEAADVTDLHIERIVVFRPATPTDEPTDGCKNGTPALGVCNVYTAGDLTRGSERIRLHTNVARSFLVPGVATGRPGQPRPSGHLDQDNSSVRNRPVG